MKCKFVWKLGYYGNGANIAVTDSGLDKFEEMQDNIMPGFNYLASTTDTNDNVGHGTFIAGIIASQNMGISYKCKIVPLKRFDISTSTYVSTITDGN